MRVILTNLSNSLYEESRFLLNSSARKFGIQEIISYDFNEIRDTAFYSHNKEILAQPKGIGYWLWKPYIILEAMKTLQDNDIVIYSDCGIEITASLDDLISICKNVEPVVLFGNGNFINAKWTKRDCFVLMDCDNQRYWNAPHCDAAFALFRKNSFSIDFLNEWLKFGLNKNIITDLPNISGLPNLEPYIEHRWDQSILSLLAEKHKISLYRMPTQFGNHYKMQSQRVENEFNCINQSNQTQLNFYHFLPYLNSSYSQLLNHHRSKKGGKNTADALSTDAVFKNRRKKKQWVVIKRYLKELIFKGEKLARYNVSGGK